MLMDRPPCWIDGQKPNPCALAHYDRVVHGHTELRADWLGWKQRGRWLVSPDGQRISPERMRGILWRQELEARRDAVQARNEKRRVLQGTVPVDTSLWPACVWTGWACGPGGADDAERMRSVVAED